MNDGANWLLTPVELRELKASIESQRSALTPFDIAPGGAERDPDPERATIKALAEAGATWWMEYVTPSRSGLDAWPYQRRATAY